MTALREYIKAILALPIDQQREALLPAYRATYGAYGVDWELNTAGFADDYEGQITGTYLLPDLPQRWYGREGYLSVHRAFRDVLNVQRVDVDDLLPLGEGRVVTLLRFVIGDGNATIEQQVLDYHQFRDGELVLQRIWLDREEGLRELGL